MMSGSAAAGAPDALNAARPDCSAATFAWCSFVRSAMSSSIDRRSSWLRTIAWRMCATRSDPLFDRPQRAKQRRQVACRQLGMVEFRTLRLMQTSADLCIRCAAREKVVHLMRVLRIAAVRLRQVTCAERIPLVEEQLPN